jgi:hypothetical protein
VRLDISQRTEVVSIQQLARRNLHIGSATTEGIALN